MRKQYLILPVLFFLFFSNIYADELKDKLEKLGFTKIEQELNYFDFSLSDIHGNILNLRDYQGKIIFLNFWATWCPPCRSEMPSMEIMNKKLNTKNFVMLAVNIEEDKKIVIKLTKKNNYTFPILLDTTGEIARKYKINAIPTTYIIDTKGKIAAVFTGVNNWSADEVISIFMDLAK
jgi:peroxiredoxin